MTTAQDGGKVVSLTHRPPLPPWNTPGTHFCQRMSRPQGHSATGRIMSPKNSNDTIGNQTRDLPVCSVAPSPLCHRAPNSDFNGTQIFSTDFQKNVQISNFMKIHCFRGEIYSRSKIREVAVKKHNYICRHNNLPTTCFGRVVGRLLYLQL